MTVVATINSDKDQEKDHLDFSNCLPINLEKKSISCDNNNKFSKVFCVYGRNGKQVIYMYMW